LIELKKDLRDQRDLREKKIMNTPYSRKRRTIATVNPIMSSAVPSHNTLMYGFSIAFLAQDFTD
jgi:hypothetical protein